MDLADSYGLFIPYNGQGITTMKISQDILKDYKYMYVSERLKMYYNDRTQFINKYIKRMGDVTVNGNVIIMYTNSRNVTENTKKELQYALQNLYPLALKCLHYPECTTQYYHDINGNHYLPEKEQMDSA